MGEKSIKFATFFACYYFALNKEDAHRSAIKR